MAILVRHGEDQTCYADATKWVVDDHERLHIVGEDGNLASFNRGYWENVQHYDIPETHN